MHGLPAERIDTRVVRLAPARTPRVKVEREREREREHRGPKRAE